MAEEYYNINKKSCYSKLRNQLKSLEDKFDILDNDLIELKWEIDDIKKILSKSKKNKVIYDSDNNEIIELQDSDSSKSD